MRGREQLRDQLQNRARITLPDILFITWSLGMLAALWPVFYNLFQDNADVIPTGAEYLWLMILPFAILILLTVIYMKAAEGLV